MFIKSSELTNRIFGLDLFRSLAIVLVLVAHTATFITGRVDHPLTICGFYGVEFFFVLSGFLIGTILLKVHNKEPNTSISSIRIFWIRRWFRTLPNYYLMLFVYLTINLITKHIFLLTDVKHLSYLVFLQNTFFTQPEFFNISWSLSIEEWFYLTFPVILLLFQYFFSDKKTSFLATITTIIVGCLLGRLLMTLSGPRDWDGWYRKLMPLRLDGIAFGVLAAFGKFYYPNFWNRHAKFLSILGITILINIFIVLYDQLLFTKDLINTGTFVKTYMFSINSLAIMLMIPFVSKIQTKVKLFSLLITITSLISYSIYLVHPLIIGILIKLHLRNYSGGLLLWIITFIVSYFQYTLFETKITKIREKLSGKNNSINVTN